MTQIMFSLPTPFLISSLKHLLHFKYLLRFQANFSIFPSILLWNISSSISIYSIVRFPSQLFLHNIYIYSKIVKSYNEIWKERIFQMNTIAERIKFAMKAKNEYYGRYYTSSPAIGNRFWSKKFSSEKGTCIDASSQACFAPLMRQGLDKWHQYKAQLPKQN